ncbi:unnamed protein product [Penicillium nalgiovense]|uniref:Uncharacterized protein n=1 Tax=Penicillium nalgiovense TaxID=60175 RepID=A0A9W4HAN7_PENNA|nr:unnamed protein product [Penicillium nalgiovense]CAG7987594.1 unnamed protein product [Penicillium nalgiovense]CAG7990639.1 unnamed protein product [Penicillium nalgiovense]CAG8028211.1 unnamed protein product [Penicillium nalgiovense]CAG8032839.1 unnamed protein product [Penicillium nalgiovense]
MGVNTRRPILPAPTESIIDTTGDSATGTDLATDISRRTDKTSYSIPDDGSPITVSTRRQRDRDEKLSRSQHDSHTSLLIEYFEGGKGSSGIVSRPSVRVRVTPSSTRKSRDKKDHFQITESSGSGIRKPSYTHRISLPSPSSKQKQLDSGAADHHTLGSNSGEEEGHHSSRREPVEIEFVNRGQDSEMSSLSQDTRYMNTASEVSSMPPDSMINASSAGPRRKRSQSMERGSPTEDKGLLKTPHRQRSRSLSHERIAHRVAEKLTGSPQEASGSKHKSKGSKDYLEAETKPSRRRKHKYAEEDIISPESSLLSTSAVSSNHKSDQYSVRSGASKSSINNPKLLETVEDAIRRLILPELKELKKDQKVMTNKNKFDRDMATSYSSGTSSRDELGRRLSKHASAPDVMKPKVVLNKDSKDEGIVLSPETVPRNTERKSSKSSETSDMAVKWANRPGYTEQDKIRRQKSKGLRDAHAAGRVGSALTAASLKHHDSNSSLGKKERRRNSGSRKSASRKSTESMNYNETELVFQKHNVAPMPMHSEIDSELTRNSLLSERTASPTPEKQASYFDVARGSPRQAMSPASRTPTRNSIDSRYELGMRHGNQSQHNISVHSASERDLHQQSQSPGTDGGNWAIAAAAAANLLDAAQPGHHETEDDYHHETTGRGLSPIQSIASDHTQTHYNDYSAHGEQHVDGKHEIEPQLSIDSLSSAPSTNLARSTRQGTSSHSQSGIFKQHSHESPGLGYEHSRQGSQDNGFYGYDQESRRSGDDRDSDVDFMEKVKEGHPVTTGIAANPQFMQPIAVESAVASLMDPSVLESQVTSSNRSQTDLAPRSGSRSPEKPGSEVYRGSPLKQRQDAFNADETSFPRRMGATSPPQSVTQSFEDMDDSAMMAANVPRGRESPRGDAESQESESEINTNPSIIQGPIGGVAQADHWGYDSRSPPADHYYDTQIGGSKGLNAEQQTGLDAEYYQTAQNIFGGDDYSAHSGDNQPRQLFGTPPGAKDEGYVSAANPMSPSIGTPKQASRGLAGVDAAGMGSFDSPAGADDPFASGERHFSGYSHGVGSPLYDSATGRGIERIQSQDIVALMDHLTVRDAQRNARDTEILVTLVRSAAEMRTSFEQMKKFIADQDDLIMDTSDRGHERTHRALGGPRPLPPSASRNRQLNTADEDDKRKSIFKRALKGLSLKSGGDLAKIEGMLEQLLGDVEALRYGQDDYSPHRVGSMDPSGYETTGPNGVSAETSRSPYGSSSSRPVNGQRRDSDQRVSTVHEVDEDLELDDRDQFLTSHLPVRDAPRHERSGSLPLDTPPRKPVATTARSTETTPKARKHKSSSSSIFPKISRWSKSTATSMGDGIRNSIQPSRKERPTSGESRSGSDLAPHGPYKGDYYDPQGDDRIRSTYTLNDDQDENRPPSPLVPSQVSEPPKYRGHRGSLELQHPQPRQGPTARYQSRLETEAQTYAGPVSPAGSDQWESNPSLSAANPTQNRNSGVSGATRLSPISDAGYSETSSRANRTPGPPRPPKVKDAGPLIPERPPKVADDEEAAYSGDRVVSRNSAIYSPPTRKPTGPRPLTSAGSYSPGNIKRTRYRGSPAQIDYEDEQY